MLYGSQFRASFLARLNCCNLNDLRCSPNSQRNLVPTENSVNKAERAKPLRTENGSCELNSCGPNWAFIDSGTAERPCEPNRNLRIRNFAVSNLQIEALGVKMIAQTFKENEFSHCTAHLCRGHREEKASSEPSLAQRALQVPLVPFEVNMSKSLENVSQCLWPHDPDRSNRNLGRFVNCKNQR